MLYSICRFDCDIPITRLLFAGDCIVAQRARSMIKTRKRTLASLFSGYNVDLQAEGSQA